jgi:hypothetical protein
MENKQDIGKAFKERLGGLQREPGDAVWQNISTSLQQQKRGGFRMPFWGRATAIVLGVVLVVVLTYPQWEQYMPEIIIKMPGEKQQNTGNATQNNGVVTNGAQSGSGISGSSNGQAGTTGQPGVNQPQTSQPQTVETRSGQNAVVHTATTPGSQGGAVHSSIRTNSSTAGTNSSHTRQAANNGTTATSRNTTVAHNNGTAQNSTVNSPKHTTATPANNAKNSNTGIASGTTPATTATGTNNAIANNNTSRQNNAANQTVVAAATPQTATQNSTQGNQPAATANNNTVKTPATGRTKSSEANLVYSTANFPTITKTMADSLVLAQKAIDDKKSRERTFAQPGYALQDNLSGGDGYRNDFYVFAFIAPTNYKFGESKSLIDPSLNSRGSSAETSNNFGAYIGYEFSSQFSVRTGISSVGITQRTGNVTMDATDYTGVDYANGMNNSQAMASLGDSPVTLRQKTNIIEVPFEATYAMFGTRADLYFKGGVSMFFMNDNQLFAENGQGSVLLGSLNRTRDFSFSGNAGFGFYYKFTRELQLNVEPGFKYYFNTFEGVNPISLYVQAGLLYRF